MLVVGITVEQMRSEYLDKYWDSFRADGFKRLMEQGTVCRNVRLDLQSINAATGTATIFTGQMPSSHGIVGRKWFKQITREQVSVISDPDCLTLGSDSDEGNCSANQLKTSTLGDVLKLQSNKKSKVYSVALNAESAVLAAGHNADGAFWFDKTNGNFISSSYYLERFPEWARLFNSQKKSDDYLNEKWETLLPIDSYTATFPDNYPLERGFWNTDKTFPFDLKKLAKNCESEYEILKATPFGNKLVKEFAETLIKNCELGKDEYTDLLTIAFSSLDFANKWFEPSSVEMHDLYLRMDQCVAQLLQTLDKLVGKDEYVVFFAASSTSDYSPKVRNEEFGFPSGDFSPQSAMALLRSYLNVLFGSGDWVVLYNEEQIYLNHDLIERRDVKLDEIQQKAALFMNQFEGVKSALPAFSIENSNLTNQRFLPIENSYCVQRSGDIVLLLEEGWAPSYKNAQVDYSSENKIPLILYGGNVKTMFIDRQIDATDIVPTICQIVGILPPDDALGKPIMELVNE